MSSPTMRELLRGLEVFAGELPGFDPGAAPDDPVELFTDWLLHAIGAEVPEPHAMTLSTADGDGEPSARVLILKDVSPRGWQFASHSGSRKGLDLAQHPYAAMTFYWPARARQVRVRGRVSPASPADSAADFLAHGATARAEALLGQQSRPLTDLPAREAAVKESLAAIDRDPGLVAPGWTLYNLRAEQAEFWQGDRDRNHTRLNYRRVDGAWEKELLWP
jgi:pyridoxamine 5'-phosphate oxidase